MYLLYCDESNLQERSGVFFVYGGLAIHSAAAVQLSHDIDDIKKSYKIPLDYHIKCSGRPPQLHQGGFVAVKNDIIEIAKKDHCTLFTSFILHDVATNPEEARRNEINRICYHFFCFLNRAKSHGLVLIDRFSDKNIDHHSREKFSVGVVFPSKKERLSNIIGFHYSAIGQSNVCTVVDIIIGSLRIAVNAHGQQDPNRRAVAESIIKRIAPLFFRESGIG